MPGAMGSATWIVPGPWIVSPGRLGALKTLSSARPPPCFAHRENARQDDLAARAIQFEMPEWHGHQMSAKSHEVAHLERREHGAVIPADHEPINGADRLLLGVHADRDDLDLLRQRRLWAHRDQDRCGQHRGQET